MTRTGTPVLATASAVCSTSATRVPPASARWVASWMTGPSISGSEYGRPISTMSAPASAMAVAAAIAPGTDGKPAGRYPTSAARLWLAAFSNAAATALIGLGSPGVPEPLGGDIHVLVAAAGQVHQQQRVGAELRSELERPGQRVRGLDRRDDPLGAAQRGERAHRLSVGDRAVAGPP